MKKLFISLVVALVILFAAVIIIPIVFKEDIKAAIDTAIAESVNADIVFDIDDFSISLLKNFPDATAAMKSFKVTNRAPFDGQTLVAAKQFEIQIDLFSLFADKIRINGLYLDSPEINILVLKDGRANYDIAIAPEDELVEGVPSQEPTKFNIGINFWQITNANIVYDDASAPLKLQIKNLNHNGKGDFNQDQFDITTSSAIDAISMGYDGIEYLSNKSVSADVVMTISDNYSRYTFKENQITINDFGLGFNGFLARNKDGSMDIDLSYEAKQTTFKSLLSLVPGIYTANFNRLEAAGKLAFSGMVKGKLDSLTKPAFNLALNVDQAMFKYPDLPSTISNINLDLFIDNQDGVIDNTTINLKQFHMDVGKSPIDAKVLVTNLVNYDMEASVQGDLNLADVSSMLPIEGMSAQGNISFDLKAQGVYDNLTGQIPQIDAVVELVNGQLSTSKLPYALEQLSFDAKVKNSTGKRADFVAVINNFSTEMDGETFTADLELANLDNYTWKINAQGGMDLEKITTLFPLEGANLTGNVKAKLATIGNIADLEAKKYHLLPTSGELAINQFNYSNRELPYNITISSMAASFDPKTISIDRYTGTIGKSDLAITGSVSNYMGYLFSEDQVLKGNMNVSANLIDLNEFMTEENEGVDKKTEKQNYAVIKIPKNIDLVMTSKINTVALMDMSIADVHGDVIVKDGIAQLSGLNFSLLSGAFVINGTYDPRDLANPKYEVNLNIAHVSANKAFDTLKMVKTYFPIAKNMDGNISSDIKLSGLLDELMLPDMTTLSGAGTLNIANATLKNSTALKGIGTLMGNTLLSKEQVSIKDILMTFSIENGQVRVKPFDLNLGDYKSTLSGTSSLSGDLDFDVKMDVPAGQFGSKLNSLLSLNSADNAVSDNTIIPLNIGIGGSVNEPTVKLKGKPTVAALIKNVVKQQANDKLGIDVGAEKEQQRQKILAEAQSQANKITTEAKKLADKVRSQGYAQAERLEKEASNNPLKRILVDEVVRKLRKEADTAADKIEAEGQEKAKALLAKATREADALE